jgi:hypothetical protein
MKMIIFFGGLVTGMLIGWLGVSLLTMVILRSREKSLGKAASHGFSRYRLITFRPSRP